MALRLSPFEHGGETGALAQVHDWSKSPLGDQESWPSSLTAIVDLVLASELPMLLAWGSELILIYNDACIQILGEKHPAAMGKPLREVWAEIGPFAERALAGEAIYRENLPLLVYRNGYDEQRWFTFSYSPVRDESGRVAGMLCACIETTEAALSARRRDALLALDDSVRDVEDPDELAFAAASIIGDLMGAARAGYGALDLVNETIIVPRTWTTSGFVDVAGVHRFADYGSFLSELRRGEVVANADVEHDPRTLANVTAFRALGIRAHLDVPVLEGGEVVGQIFIHSAVPRCWTQDEIDFARDFAERTRVAIARRLAEQDLRKNEAELAARIEADRSFTRLFQASPAPFLVLKPDSPHFTIAEVNDAYLAATMRRREDLVGRGLFKAFPDNPENQDINGVSTLRASLERVLATGKADPLPCFEYDIVRPDGTFEERWWSPVNSPVLDDEGRIEAIIHNANDITEQQVAEERLRLLNETLEAQVLARSAERDRLWSLSQDMLARADFSGMMSAVSPAWTKVLGWSEQELLSRGYANFMHPEDETATLSAIALMAETRQPTRFENRISTRDGGWKPIEWIIAPEPDGVNFIAVGRDLSIAKAREAELGAAQEALRQSQKMEAMGQLTGGVAHDFNNLLTPIVGALDLLQRQGTGGEREQRLIGGAAQSAERARTLVQRLLAFARRQPLQAVPVDVARLVSGIGDLVASTTGPQIKVVIDAAEGLPAANADPNQLEMALLNLAVNARDAMPDGGTLRISARAETISADHASKLQSGNYVRLSVADTGAGMDAETLARAVEPFFSTKGIGKGTGLGLSMVHGLASQLGGALTIQSQPGRGTIVELWLPRSSAAPKQAEDGTAITNAITRQGTALLVEDEDLVRYSTADMLMDFGFRVIDVPSAKDAIRLIDDGGDFDLLVTDHLMPGMTGTELARELRKRTPKIPILLVSGYAELDGLDPSIPRLAKPFRKDELASRLLQIGAFAD